MPALSGANLDDQVVVLDQHRKAFGDVGPLDPLGLPFLLDGSPGNGRHLIGSDPGPHRVDPRLPGPNVEFPSVPRAAQDLARPAVAVIARDRTLEEARQAPRAERAALVRAAIAQGEEL